MRRDPDRAMPLGCGVVVVAVVVYALVVAGVVVWVAVR